jgi:hypothetical protein
VGCANSAENARGDARRQVGAAVVDVANGAHDLCDVCPFEQVARGSSLDRAKDLFVGIIGGKHKDARRGRGLEQPRNRRHAIHAGELEIE